MRLPLVPRSELSLAHSEVEEWRRRAELNSLLDEDDTRAPARIHARRRSWSGRLGQLLTVLVVTAAVALGALLLPARTQSASPDYSGCIGKARYERPIEGNQYQELVNALYACGVYRLP